MKAMLDGINLYELAVQVVVEAPDIQLKFRMYPEVASARKVRIEGWDRVRAIELVNGAWAILGVLATELEMQAREEGEPTSMSEPERRRQWDALDREYARLIGRRVDAVPAFR